MEVEIKAVKAWGVERDGKLLPQAEDCRPPFPWVGERDVRVRILREADYRRLLKTAGGKTWLAFSASPAIAATVRAARRTK